MKEKNIVEIMILIVRIIMLILTGMSSVGAVAKASGVASATLWNKLPNRFK